MTTYTKILFSILPACTGPFALLRVENVLQVTREELGEYSIGIDRVGSTVLTGQERC